MRQLAPFCTVGFKNFPKGPPDPLHLGESTLGYTRYAPEDRVEAILCYSTRLWHVTNVACIIQWVKDAHDISCIERTAETMGSVVKSTHNNLSAPGCNDIIQSVACGFRHMKQWTLVVLPQHETPHLVNAAMFPVKITTIRTLIFSIDHMQNIWQKETYFLIWHDSLSNVWDNYIKGTGSTKKLCY